jgi:cob(I)alamin adenosyltransferase
MEKNIKKNGLILVFTGDGKGKTTAALGAALRMISHGGRVGMVQFFKVSMARVSWPGFRVWSFGGGFTWQVPREENARVVAKAWEKCRALLRDAKYDLVIFDEIHIALKYKFLKSSEVIKALKAKRPSQHVILTGRGAPKSLLKMADLVTEMKCLKHPFDKGIPAVPGIDF